MMESKMKLCLKQRLEKGAGWYWILFALVLLIVCFLSFYQLDTKYVDPFDEARHGVNAYEMFRAGNLVESTYCYETDYYNLKPPLSMWGIMLGFMILGKNVLALRAYSAICYIVLVACVGLFVKRNYGCVESLFAMGFLAINTAPFEAHMIRAGDADSLYVLLFSLAMLFMMEIPKKKSNLYWCGFFFALAFLTKSFHAGMIVVIGGLYLLFTGELKKIRLKEMLFFGLATILPVAVWGIFRVSVDGLTFFKQMLFVDVLNRTSGVLNNNQQPFFWYTEYFLGTMSGKITVYLWAFVICIVGSVYFSKLFTKQNYKKILGYILWILVPYLAFSLVTNKLIWYMYPVTIPLLMCAGIVIGRLLKEKTMAKVVKTALVISFFVLIIYYGKGEIDTIKKQGPNDFQQFLTQVAKEYGDTVTTAYLSVPGGAEEPVQSTWAQQDVYLAEVYGDLFCDNGGVEGFDAAQKAILFVGNEVLEDVINLKRYSEEGSEMLVIKGENYTALIK